jgi:hypothetical protein
MLNPDRSMNRLLLRNIVMRLILCALMLLVECVAHADVLRVSLLVSDTSPPYKQLSDVLVKGASQSVNNFRIVDAGEPYDLQLVSGMKALDSVLGVSEKPIVALMLPQSGYQTLLRKYPRGAESTAVFLDQPRERQMRFVRTMFPRARKVALLYSSDAKDNISAWTRAANESEIALAVHAVASRDDLFSALEGVLSEASILLATPDNAIYNSSSIRNILLTSYRWRVPMIGFSQGYVNAGAVGALFSTPEQIGLQAVEMIVSYAQTGKLPQAGFPQDYEVAINDQVARSLGLDIPTPRVIKQRMSVSKGEAR